MSSVTEIIDIISYVLIAFVAISLVVSSIMIGVITYISVLELKKEHPCGSRRWQVLRVGMDFRLRCAGCGHELMIPRSKAEKSIKKIIRPGEDET